MCSRVVLVKQYRNTSETYQSKYIVINHTLVRRACSILSSTVQYCSTSAIEQCHPDQGSKLAGNHYFQLKSCTSHFSICFSSLARNLPTHMKISLFVAFLISVFLAWRLSSVCVNPRGKIPVFNYSINVFVYSLEIMVTVKFTCRAHTLPESQTSKFIWIWEWIAIVQGSSNELTFCWWEQRMTNSQWRIETRKHLYIGYWMIQKCLQSVSPAMRNTKGYRPSSQKRHLSLELNK